MAGTARNSKLQRAKTLCERSTKVALNITKLSSLYLARVTLGSRRAATERTVEISVPVSSHKPNKGSSASKYVIEPKEGDGVDERATKYIRRVRERNELSDPAGVGKEA